MTADRLLLDALAHLVDHLDPTPDELAGRAAGALAERVEATPMRMLTDSALVTPPGTRGRCATRTLRFVGLDLLLDQAINGLHATGLAGAGLTGTGPANADTGLHHAGAPQPHHSIPRPANAPHPHHFAPAPADAPAPGSVHPGSVHPRLPTSALLVPGAVAVVRWPGGEARTPVDRAGWFHLDGVPSGPVRFLLLGPATRHATPWFVA
ncbi:hypothetical protein Q5530_08770 [Saccharothrix sp. BKS2]|uniref:hypothetical protein n=1 Tax=Saccharothrix sp. BKS2 TaxID=3064400 RepID=UPI0039E9BF02